MYHSAEGKKYITMEQKTAWFEAEVRDAEEELNKLHERWEMIVGEIWKCGTQVLGDRDMEAFLSSGPTTSAVPKTSEKAPDASRDKSSLSVPEVMDNSDNPRIEEPARVRKQVAFKPPPPKFLTLPSEFNNPLVGLPDLPVQKIKEMEQTVKVLGDEHASKLANLERTHKSWWATKCEQIEFAMAMEF